MKEFIAYLIIVSVLALGCVIVAITENCGTETIRDLNTGIRYENVNAVYHRGAVSFEYNGETYHLSNYVVE